MSEAAVAYELRVLNQRLLPLSKGISELVGQLKLVNQLKPELDLAIEVGRLREAGLQQAADWSTESVMREQREQRVREALEELVEHTRLCCPDAYALAQDALALLPSAQQQADQPPPQS